MIQIFINILLVLHVVVSLGIVFFTLMQRPKNEGLGAAFGGGVMDTIMGPQTTNILQTITRWLGGAFFAITILLSWLYVKHTGMGKSSFGSKVEGMSAPATPAPATPAPATPAPAAGEAANADAEKKAEQPGAASDPVKAPAPGEAKPDAPKPEPEAKKDAPAPENKPPAEKKPDAPAPADAKPEPAKPADAPAEKPAEPAPKP